MATPTDPTPKTKFAADLIERTAAVLPPGRMQSALRHPGSDEYEQAFVFATMIELAQQAPGPMSDKAKAAQSAQAAQKP